MSAIDKIEPKWTVLLVRRDAQPKQVGSIVLPEATTDHANSGVIEKVGYAAHENYRVGQRIVFREFAGMAIDVEGEEFLLLAQEDVMATVDA